MSDKRIQEMREHLVVEPSKGGCWFCYTDQGDMLFDTEFDTWVHESCLRKELKKTPVNPEARIMKYLLEVVK